MSFCPPGFRQKLHFIGFCLWIVAWTLLWRPRWIYASEHISCSVALLLSFLPGIRVIYHEHDTPASPPSYLLAARRALIARAALCIWPNAERSTPGPTTRCVWNCPSRDEVGTERAAPEPGRLVVYYHGSINQQRLPASLIQALALLPAGVTLQTAGYEAAGDTNHIQNLKDEAARLGVGARFQHLGAVPARRDLLDHCRRADVGVIFMPKGIREINLQNMTGASNKPFDYLACGLALLVTDLPDWTRMYADAGYALACNPDDPASIAAALRRFLERPDEMRAMGERGRQRILADWNYETQFRPVLEIMESL